MKIKLKMNKYGLINLGNTCYLNSIFQLFIRCFDFNKELIETVSITDAKSLMISYRTIVNRVMTKKEEDKITCFKITSFYDKYKEMFPYLIGMQQDADECFQLLLNTFHEELRKTMNRRNFKKIMENIDDDYKRCARDDIYNLYKKEYSILSKYFYGTMLSTTTCQDCDHEIEKYEIFGNLQVSFDKETNLEKIIEDNYQEEQLEDYKCSKCQQTNNIKKLTIVGYPKYLVISLKRFKYCPKRQDFVKNMTPVDVVDELNINDCKYDLLGMVNHHGHMNGGHYTSHIKYEDGWNHFDDESVKPMKKINRNSAYVLLYQLNSGNN